MKMNSRAIFGWKLLMSCLVMGFLVLDLMAFANWRNAFSPVDAGSLAAEFGPTDHRRSVIRALDANSPLAAAGAKVGDEVSFDRGSDAYRVLGTDETVSLELYTAAGKRSLTVHPSPDRTVEQHSGVYAAGFLAEGVCSLFALTLALLIALRRPESGALRGLAIGLLVNSIDFFTTYLPGSALQNIIDHYLRLVLVMPCVLGFLFFSLCYPEEQPLWRLRSFRAAFWTIAAMMAAIATVLLTDRWHGLTPALSVPVQKARYLVYMSCHMLVVASLCTTWASSRGETRHRMAWIAVCLGTPIFWYILSNAVALFGLMSQRYLDMYGSLANMVAYVGLGYALLRHHLFNFSFAVNRTLVFTVTSLLLFVAFWLIEQIVHKLIHFEAAENNAMLAGAIAFGLFFAFNRLHHRVDHWIEHLLFRQWREKESALRAFVAKGEHFTERGSLVAAFGAALDRFSDGAGNAIYLALASGSFERVYGSLRNAPEVLDVDDDIAVSLRATHQGISFAEIGPACQAQLALPMIQGGELKGIILLGPKPEAQGYRPDEHAVLEFAAGRIAADLNRLLVAQLAAQVREAQRDQEVQRQQHQLVVQELAGIKQERALLMLALSKVATVN